MAGPADFRESELSRYRRNLPHCRLAGATYFVTWRFHPSQPELVPEERDQVVAALRHFDGERYDLLCFVVMHDHVRVILKPSGERRMEQITHSWKSFTANRLHRHHGRKGSVWQDESYDRIIRDEDEYWVKVQYVLENHRKRWPEIGDYPWVWLRS